MSVKELGKIIVEEIEKAGGSVVVGGCVDKKFGGLSVVRVGDFSRGEPVIKVAGFDFIGYLACMSGCEGVSGDEAINELGLSMKDFKKVLYVPERVLLCLMTYNDGVVYYTNEGSGISVVYNKWKKQGKDEIIAGVSKELWDMSKGGMNKGGTKCSLRKCSLHKSSLCDEQEISLLAVWMYLWNMGKTVISGCLRGKKKKVDCLPRNFENLAKRGKKRGNGIKGESLTGGVSKTTCMNGKEIVVNDSELEIYDSRLKWYEHNRRVSIEKRRFDLFEENEREYAKIAHSAHFKISKKQIEKDWNECISGGKQ